MLTNVLMPKPLVCDDSIGGRIAGVLGEQPARTAGRGRCPAATDVGQDEAEHDGEGGGEHEEADGLAADAAELAQVAEAGDAECERA
jgi:hypothetical protein